MHRHRRRGNTGGTPLEQALAEDRAGQAVLRTVERAEQARGKLDPAKLYLGDNGRVFCGALRCAGASAYFSGRDLSGQAVQALTPEAVRAHGFACEGCGR